MRRPSRAGFVFPRQGPIQDIQAIDAAVVGTNIDILTTDGRRGMDGTFRKVSPTDIAIFRIQTVNPVVG